MVTRRAHAGGRSGQALPLIVVFMVVLLAFAGLVIDLGNAYRVQQALQASTDASAAAGAGQLTLAYPPNTGNAIARAQYYGSEPGGHNSIPGVPSSGMTQTVSTSCVLTVSTLPCTNANTVPVKQSASVPTYFLRVLGVNSLKISTSAQACSPCNEIPLDIQLVIDRTGSMADQSSGIVKWTALQQGLLQGFLPGLDPSVDYVGLSTLPPDTNGTSDICKAETGTSPSPDDAPNPTYTVVHLSNNHMNSTGQLIASSPLVSDINCMKPGGGTDYADAMTAAYAELQANGRPSVQKVIVLLSDGAANNGQGCVTTTKKVGGKTVTGQGHEAALHPALPERRQRRRHLQGEQCPDLHHPLRRPVGRPGLRGLHRRQRSTRDPAMDGDAEHRQPRQLLPGSKSREPADGLPGDLRGHGRRLQPHRQLTRRPRPGGCIGVTLPHEPPETRLRPGPARRRSGGHRGAHRGS
jgi:Flp pilus assembly protein TadG